MTPDIVQHALLLSLALFGIGAVGVFLRRNIIIIFMCVELMLNAVNLSFIAFSGRWARGTAGVVSSCLTCRGRGRGGAGPRHSMQRHPDTLDVDPSTVEW